MRLLTFNIAHGRGLSLYHGWQSPEGLRRNLDRIGQLLREWQPDVVALQEVDVDSHWNHRLDLLEYLREVAGYPHAELAATNQRGGDKPLHYGNGLLSRWPIGHWERLLFQQSTIWGKGLLWAEIALPEGPRLPIINLHLDFASRRKRIAQIEELVALLHQKAREREPSPNGQARLLDPIICGDFNAADAPARDAVRHLRHHLPGEADYQVAPRRARTFPAFLPALGIDFVFVPHCLELTRTEVIRTYTSDHRPVLVDLRLREGT